MFGRKKDKEDERREDEDLREEMRRLEEQMRTLRRRLEDDKSRAPPPPIEPKEPKAPKIPKAKHHARKFRDEDVRAFEEDVAEFGRQMGNYGRELGDYIKIVVADAMKGANKAMRSIFIGPDGDLFNRDADHPVPSEDVERIKPVPPEDAERLLSPLASGERISLLYLLAEEPRYHQDLMELSGLKPGTLPHHLKQLEEAGYVTQERVRGRYLITIPGRMALKLAEYLHYQMESGTEK
ncbi:MAG: winged helix-turn-helix domain-containing protein [Candidatus Hermodarchaeota archaeon]|nr:winged helix-turn-helix domain-containing protein [Candidatus Hermodarchaeota archaeon]